MEPGRAAEQVETKRRRVQCPLCKETLSYSAFCRHQQTRSCVAAVPGESVTTNTRFDDGMNLEEDNSVDDYEYSIHAEMIESSCATLSEFSCSSSCSDCDDSDLAPEILESESESDAEQLEATSSPHVKSLHYVLSYFLLFFQLCYHVSDRGLKHILNLISSIFRYIPKLFMLNQSVEELVHEFPKTLYSLKKQFDGNNLKRYCVCPSCHTMYDEESCFVASSSGNSSRKCDHIEFPFHPQKSRRSKCGTDLMKKIKVGKKYKFVPRKTFVYNSIKNSLERFASRPGFFESCEVWRSSREGGDFMVDVYDGKLWKDWEHFLAIPGNLLVMLNVDWFKVFKHSTYSVGVMYLVIQNLPRTLRFKPENIIIVGTLPGPQEPKLTINTYLQPMIDELLKLWTGIEIKAEASVLGIRTVRVALACISCDIPATRKLCGFYGFKAKRGCSKCMKTFPTPTFSESTDYSGFDIENWPRRDMNSHRDAALKAQGAVTKTARAEIERRVGVRYSDLLRLPYFDIVRCHMIDPMHNLFLGTAKNVTTLWKDTKVISDAAFIAIQEKVDAIAVPASIGRIPGKISSGFYGFTAQQWMLWTVVYSPFVLKDVLPSEHYNMWCAFSFACSLLCRPFIHHSEVLKADQLLLKFCRLFENVFGTERVTPNMHLHGHLKQCVEDMGPVYSFWCFSFERYNGILESFQKNWRSPEVQIMEKFTLMQTLNAINIHTKAPPEFTGCLDFIKRHYTILESPDKIFDSGSLLNYEKNIFCLPKDVCAIKSEWHNPIPPLREKFFDENTRCHLRSMYTRLYNISHISHVPLKYIEFHRLELFGREYISLKSRSQRSCAIMAMWSGLTGEIILRSCNSEDIRSGLIEYFVLHTPTTIDGSIEPHLLAKVKWFEDHPRKDWFKNSIVLSATLFSAESEASFIPVSRIMSRCATIEQSLKKFDYGEDNTVVCMPLIRRVE